MKKRINMKKVLRQLLVTSICAVLTLSVSLNVYAENLDTAKDQLTDLQKQKKELENKIAGLEKEKNNVASYIEKLDKQMAELDGKIENLNTQITETSSLLDTTRSELQDAKDTQTEQYDIMKARVKYMFENGNDDYFSMLLESSTLEDFLNNAEYISKISEYDQGLYTRYETTTQEIAKKEKKISENLEKLNTLQGELQIQKDGLDTLTANKRNELKKYETSINTNQNTVDKYSEQIEEQEALVQQMIVAEQKRQEALRKKQEEKKRQEELKKKQEEEAKRQQEARQNSNNNSNEGQGNGSTDSTTDGNEGDIVTSGTIPLRWPLNISGTITSHFANRINPVTGRAEGHKGLDIAAPAGTPIVAAASGTVLVATYSSVMGNYVIVSHSSDFYTIYMHSSALKVSAGEKVSKGQTIALVGTTGQSTGNHLHFGVCYNGVYVNPENYVRRP